MVVDQAQEGEGRRPAGQGVHQDHPRDHHRGEDRGGDPEGNARLRAAILAAKAVNMPNDNISRAIKKGTGELEGVSYEEYMYEGYGQRRRGAGEGPHRQQEPHGRRSPAHLHEYNGNLGETGCVNWMFGKKGSISVLKESVGEEKLMELALDLGADDVDNRSRVHEFEVRCEPEAFET